MTADQFCFWLQGFFELRHNRNDGIDADQTKIIRAHLNLAFVHDIDAKMGNASHQSLLNEVHQSGSMVSAGGIVNNKPQMRC